MRTLLGTYFDGDAVAARAAARPDPMGSPLHQFRTEMTRVQEAQREARGHRGRATARASERAKSAAKGADFEELLEGMLGETVRGTGDIA